MRFNGEIVIFGIFLYIMIRVVKFAFKKTFVWFEEIIRSLFVLYSLMVISVTLFPISIGIPHEKVLSSFVNYIPLVSIIRNIGQIGIAYGGDTLFMIKLIARNVGGNILLLMPLGFLAPFIWKNCKRLKISLTVGILVSLSIESLQFIEILLGVGFARAVDIDDVICNVAGMVLGCLIYRFIIMLAKKTSRRSSHLKA